MAAPAGNQFWKMRSTHGRSPIFASPDDLWTACDEYFDWVHDNPLMETELVKFQGDAKPVAVPKMRAMTISGLCIFLDITNASWFEYAKRKDFIDITARVTEIIRTQKFEGASADLLNANIIARDLGLSEKTEHTGKDGAPIVPEVSARDLAKAVAGILAKGVKSEESNGE